MPDIVLNTTNIGEDSLSSPVPVAQLKPEWNVYLRVNVRNWDINRDNPKNLNYLVFKMHLIPVAHVSGHM